MQTTTVFQTAVADVMSHANTWAQRQVADLIDHAQTMAAAERLAGHLRIRGIQAQAKGSHDGQSFCLLIITEPIDKDRVIAEISALELPAELMTTEDTHSVIETTWGGHSLPIVIPDPWFMGHGVTP